MKPSSSCLPRQTLLLLCLLAAWAVPTLPAQEPEVRYNEHYRFPASVGVEYHSLSPFAQYGAQYNIYELAAAFRLPIPAMPSLQPGLRLGLLHFDNQDPLETRNWDHNHYYASLGLTYAHRFARSFEVAAELYGGYSMAVFQELLPEEGSKRTDNLLLEAAARIALDPAFNFSIDVRPGLKYLLPFGSMQDFAGPLFSIGFSASYRFGQDPDAPTAIIRSLRFDELSVPSAFAAMQSYYVRNPLGTVRFTNTENQPVTDVSVAFFQPGYMDSPTPAGTFPQIAAGEGLEVPLFASFNRQVFTTEGTTPLTGEVIVTYRFRGRAAEQRQSVAYDLYDKTAVTWDDDRKVAAFITPADSALRNYASFIRQAGREAEIATFNGPLQYAMQVYRALEVVGCLYQADPVLPFTQVQGDTRVVDSVNLPRSTLKRITGDCDDLTVLYCSLLEAAGIPSGFITVPGHIYAAFNSGVPAREFAALHPERAMMIVVDGELWVPVEITLIGKEGFLAAWRRGSEQWLEWESDAQRRRLYRTRSAQELYRPVGLTETDLGLQYGRPEAIGAAFRQDLGQLVDMLVRDQRLAAERSGSAQAYNRLGIFHAQLMRYDDARAAFQQALRVDPGHRGASVNLGNVLYLKKDYAGALRAFDEVMSRLERAQEANGPLAAKVLLNIAKAHYQLERYGEAQEYFARARGIDAETVSSYSYLAQAGEGEARAAAAGRSAQDILFVEGE